MCSAESAKCVLCARHPGRWARAVAATVAAVFLSQCGPAPAPARQDIPRRLTARFYDSQFAYGRATYNAVSRASDGAIYYVISSEKLEAGGRMFRLDPSTERVQPLGDLTEVCGEKGLRAIPQGKSHVNFVERDGKLYFSTHVAYYNVKGAKEIKAAPPPGYKPYPGGHFLAYDLKTGAYENLAVVPFQEGIISMAMDTRRGRIFGVTWPTGHFVAYDLATRSLRTAGPVEERGEAGVGPTYRTVCRSLVVDPRDGAAYLSTARGDILVYRYEQNALQRLTDVDLRKDYFGQFDLSVPGHMGYHWRQTFWYEPDGAIYGVHGNSGYLFRFLPAEKRVEVLERLTSEPSRRSGMSDMYYYGYLGLALGPDGHTVYYLTGGPIPGAPRKQTGVLGVRGEENLHLVTYDIPTGRYRDHGPVFTENGERPTHVNSIAVGGDGSVYALGEVRGRTDLLRILPEGK
jgi:hypothetical protein